MFPAPWFALVDAGTLGNESAELRSFFRGWRLFRTADLFLAGAGGQGLDALSCTLLLQLLQPIKQIANRKQN